MFKSVKLDRSISHILNKKYLLQLLFRITH